MVWPNLWPVIFNSMYYLNQRINGLSFGGSTEREPDVLPLGFETIKRSVCWCVFHLTSIFSVDALFRVEKVHGAGYWSARQGLTVKQSVRPTKRGAPVLHFHHGALRFASIGIIILRARLY